VTTAAATEPVAASAADVEASAVVPAPPADVFDFLADLSNHWVVADGMVEVLAIDHPHASAPAAGGRVRLRGPLGLRRTAVTTVERVEAPRLLVGSASVGRGTSAHVSWTLEPHPGGGTNVRLAARVERAAPLDRAALALGGRAWLERRFRGTLERLAAQFGA
jgi:uncharacterized protein YndB with AHSA1/START domain